MQYIPPVPDDTVEKWKNSLPDTRDSQTQCDAVKSILDGDLCSIPSIEKSPVVDNWCTSLELVTNPQKTRSAATTGGKSPVWNQTRVGACVAATFPDEKWTEMTKTWYQNARETILDGKPIGVSGWWGGNIHNSPESVYWTDENGQYHLCPFAEKFDCKDRCKPTYSQTQLEKLSPKDADGNGPCQDAFS